jgi:uncharacterized phiE125 gp8 family phage protein
MTTLHALAPVRTTPPAGYPVEVAALKQHLRVEYSDDDMLITLIRDAAVAYLDGWSGILGRCLINQTWAQSFPAFPCGALLRLPFPDVSAVASVAYVDSAGAAQTLSSSLYRVGNDALGGFIMLDDSAAWPTTAIRPAAVTVTFTAGYGANATAVPPSICAAVLLIAGSLWLSRETTVSEKMRDNPTLDMLLAPHRRVAL